MPELPEVEAVRRTLQPVMEGARFEKVLANRPDLRAALPSRFAARLRGQTVLTLGRRGKYLVAELSSRQMLLMHLGMSGSFRIDRGHTAARAHDHVVFHMSSGATITFNDPRRFGMMELVSTAALPRHRAFRLLGPEPLAPGLATSTRRKHSTMRASRRAAEGRR